MIQCKLTGKTGAPVSAHIVPESFYQFSKNNRKSAHLIESRIGSTDFRLKRSPKGIYDKKILIDEGERYFSDPDDYANHLIIEQNIEKKEIVFTDNVRAFEIEKYNYHLLKLFFLSVLWRMSVSDHKMFADVDLGEKHEGIIRKAILEKDPGAFDFYPIILGYYDDVRSFGILQPFKERYAQSTHYKLYLSKVVALIKVDSRSDTPIIRGVAMEDNVPLRIVNLGGFRESFMWKQLHPILKKMDQAQQGSGGNA